jgi:hypothetical protein
MVDETTAFVGATGSCRQRMINDMMIGKFNDKT